MPVRKFRHPDEMRGLRWLDPGDPRIPRRLRFLLELARRSVVVHRRLGVRKFRSMVELNAAREAWGRELLWRPVESPPDSE